MDDEDRRIAAADEVPEDGSLLVTLRDGGAGGHADEVEAVLVRANGSIHAWRNYCPHWTDVRLDKGSGAATRDDELLCRKHGAMFEKDSGRCTVGPCEGATLGRIDVTVEGGAVYLVDEGYEFVRRGPASDGDLSSRGGIGF